MKASRQYAKDIIQQCLTSAGMNENDVTDILDKMLTDQHEATWAMAIEAAAKHVENGIDLPVGTPWSKDDKPSKHDKCIHGVWMYEDCEQCVPASIRSIPCPPLQTNKEKCK